MAKANAAMKLDADRVMSGTFGEAWFDGEELAEVESFEATVEVESEDVPVAGRYTTDQKFMGYKGAGSLKLHKLNSRVVAKLSEAVKKGVNPKIKILSSLNDPAAWGAERVLIKDAKINKFSLANWELKKKLEEEFPFTFTDWDLKDTVKPQ